MNAGWEVAESLKSLSMAMTRLLSASLIKVVSKCMATSRPLLYTVPAKTCVICVRGTKSESDANWLRVTLPR